MLAGRRELPNEIREMPGVGPTAQFVIAYRELLAVMDHVRKLLEQYAEDGKGLGDDLFDPMVWGSLKQKGIDLSFDVDGSVLITFSPNRED